MMHVILSMHKCNCAKNIYDCLEYFVLKVEVEVGDKELEGNVGYGFMLFYLLKLKGIMMKPGKTYLFKTRIPIYLKPP